MNEQLVGDATSAKNELQSLAARHRELEGRCDAMKKKICFLDSLGSIS